MSQTAAVRVDERAAAQSRGARLLSRFHEVRDFTTKLAADLAPEDCVVQSIPDVSPTKWHLAHTTWFFETFILKKWMASYRPEIPEYAFLFNSYYNAVGVRHCRPNRGQLARPTVDEIYAYADKAPGTPMDPKVLEFLRFVVSQEGQAEIMRDGEAELGLDEGAPLLGQRETVPALALAVELGFLEHRAQSEHGDASECADDEIGERAVPHCVRYRNAASRT